MCRFLEYLLNLHRCFCVINIFFLDSNNHFTSLQRCFGVVMTERPPGLAWMQRPHEIRFFLIFGFGFQTKPWQVIQKSNEHPLNNERLVHLKKCRPTSKGKIVFQRSIFLGVPSWFFVEWSSNLAKDALPKADPDSDPFGWSWCFRCSSIRRKSMAALGHSTWNSSKPLVVAMWKAWVASWTRCLAIYISCFDFFFNSNKNRLKSKDDFWNFWNCGLVGDIPMNFTKRLSESTFVILKLLFFPPKRTSWFQMILFKTEHIHI